MSTDSRASRLKVGMPVNEAAGIILSNLLKFDDMKFSADPEASEALLVMTHDAIRDLLLVLSYQANEVSGSNTPQPEEPNYQVVEGFTGDEGTE